MKKIILTVAIIITFIFAYSQEYDDVYYNPKKDTVTTITNNYFTIDWTFNYTPLNYQFSWGNIYPSYYGYYDPYYFYDPPYFPPYYYSYYRWDFYRPYWHYYNWNYYYPYNHYYGWYYDPPYKHHNYKEKYYGPRKHAGSYSTPPRKQTTNVRTTPQRYTPVEYKNKRSSQEYTSPKYRKPQENNGKTPTYWRDFNDMSKPAPMIERQRHQSNDRINRTPSNPSPQRNTGIKRR